MRRESLRRTQRPEQGKHDETQKEHITARTRTQMKVEDTALQSVYRQDK